MQNDGQFGGSTPSIYNALSANYENSESCKPFEMAETKSARNYYDIEKIDFDKSVFMNGQPRSSESSSSDNSIYSEGRGNDSGIKLDQSVCNSAIRIKNQPILPRCKNSAENLSEDSGYGEFNSMKHRSKSIPSFNQEHFIEEEEGENHKSLENVYSRQHFDISSANNKSLASTHSTIHSTKRGSGDGRQPSLAPHSKIAAPMWDSAPAPLHVVYQNKDASRNSIKAASESSTSPLQNNISASLPDILDHLSVYGDSDSGNLGSSSKQRKKVQNGCDSSVYDKDFSVVSSVPNLNICCGTSNGNVFAEDDRHRDDIECWSFNSVSICSRYNSYTSDSVASKNFDLGDFGCRFTGGSGSVLQTDQSLRQQKVINASYSNLTLLDYSGTPLGSSLRIMADKQKRASAELDRGSSLLDEISAHFDRDLSIMNDQTHNYDPSETFLRQERIISRPQHPPPQPPPRKQQPPSENTANAELPTLTDPKPKEDTPERELSDAGNRLSDNLEVCTFNSDRSSDVEDEDELDFHPSAAHSTPNKREFVVSTPNLYLVKKDFGEDYLQISSTHNSMNILPQNGLQDKGRGILSDGSRNSLGKGVSFCPVVSEISWREQSSEEGVESSGNDIR